MGRWRTLAFIPGEMVSFRKALKEGAWAVLKATLAAGLITDNTAGRGQKHGHQAGADLSHPGERSRWPSQVVIGQTVRDEHILDRLGKQRKCNLPKTKQNKTKKTGFGL